MRKMILNLMTRQFASRSVIVLISCVIVFHLMVIADVIPDDIVWGGGARDRNTTIMLEVVSIIINIGILTVTLNDAGTLKLGISRNTTRVIFWVLFGLFMLNTVGNLFSESKWETLIFTPMTLFLSVCCLRLALENSNQT